MTIPGLLVVKRKRSSAIPLSHVPWPIIGSPSILSLRRPQPEAVKIASDYSTLMEQPRKKGRYMGCTRDIYLLTNQEAAFSLIPTG